MRYDYHYYTNTHPSAVHLLLSSIEYVPAGHYRYRSALIVFISTAPIASVCIPKFFIQPFETYVIPLCNTKQKFMSASYSVILTIFSYYLDKHGQWTERNHVLLPANTMTWKINRWPSSCTTLLWSHIPGTYPTPVNQNEDQKVLVPVVISPRIFTRLVISTFEYAEIQYMRMTPLKRFSLVFQLGDLWVTMCIRP